MRPTTNDIVHSIARHTNTPADIIAGRRPAGRWAAPYRAAVAFICRQQGHGNDAICEALGYKSKAHVPYAVKRMRADMSIDGDLLETVISVMREFDEPAALRLLAEVHATSVNIDGREFEIHTPEWMRAQNLPFVEAMRRAHPERELDFVDGRFVKPEPRKSLRGN